MFGQQNTTPFGSPPATSPFGAPQQQQQSAFGASPAPAFGSSFGQPQQQQTSAFGQPAQQQQQTGGFGGFGGGSTTPAPASGFGTFGSTTSTTTQSPFGAPAPAAPTGGLFGSSTPAPAPTGGLFGGGTTSTAFGSTTTSQPSTFGGGGGGFGSTTTSGTFGATSSAPAFGSNTQQGGSIFGTSPSPAPSAFGAPVGGSIFGSTPAAAPTGSVFGGSPVGGGGMFGQQQQGVTGTASAPFQPTTKSDGTSSNSVVFQSITAMPQYESSGKSFEELRFEDYSQGNRGTGSATQQPATGGFGSTFGGAPTPAPSGGLFGSTAPAPAAPTFGGFGAPAPAPATGGLFGSTPAPAPAFGGFGAPAPAPTTGGLFGSTPAPAPAFGGFGAPAPAPTGGLFGSPSPAPAPGGLFGSSAPSTASAPAFGGFGAPAPAPTGGLFGAPAPAPSGGLFGSLAPAPSGGLFGGSAPAPAPGGLFGSTPAPAPTTGFGFGQPAAAPTSAFGASGGTSIFGAPAPAPSGGLFSAPAPQSTGLFGAPAAQPPAAQPFASPVAVIIPPATDAVLQQQLAAIENSRKELESMEVWRGGSPNTSSVVPSSNPESQALRVSPYSPPMSSAVPYRASPRSTAKIRPRGFETPKLASSQKAPLPFMSPDGFVASATKRLVIKSSTPKPSMRLRLRDVAAEETKEDVRDDVILTLPAVSPPAPAAASPPAVETPVPVASPPATAATPGSTASRRSTPPTNGQGYDFYKKVVSSAGATPASTKKSPEAKEDLAPKLSLVDYTVSPSLEEMASMSDVELATISGFTVSRTGVGSICWDGSVDVRGVDLDEIISINPRDVAVYDDAENNGTKPPVGDKLNRSAVITMYEVLPKQGSDAAAIEKFERKIARSTRNMNAELISYDSNSGVWKFRVPHFSRYALVDDSDDEGEDMEVVAETTTPSTLPNFESGERGGRSPQERDSPAAGSMDVGESWFDAFHNKDGIMVDIAVVREKEADKGAKSVVRAAEKAYNSLSTSVANGRAQQAKQKSILKKQKKMEKKREEASALFPDEGTVVDDEVAVDYVPRATPNEADLAIRSGPGICAGIAEKCGIQSFSASSTDFGMRMGRSFRVGWKPDGSFLHLQPGSATLLQQSKPVLTDNTVTLDESAKLLETHLIHSEKVISPLRECPSFCLAPDSDGNLRKALSDYVAASAPQEPTRVDPEEGLALMRAFSLMLSLFTKERRRSNDIDVPMIEGADEGKARAALTEKDRIDACVKWLTAACAEDVHSDVQDALGKNDVHSAIFAASTGGDIEQASAIAMNHGYLHLATLLAGGSCAFDALGEQVQQWNESGAAATIPPKLLRLYTILGGDLGAEENIHSTSIQSGHRPNLDWRRRLCMLLTFGVHQDDEAALSSLVEKYEGEIAGCTSPYPSPRYIWNRGVIESSGPRSLLYRILALTKTIGESDDHVESLANVVSPSGYTDALTDFSGSFHVAAAISALGVGVSLSPVEQGWLLDSYASQLVSCGRWDLAVYVMLCSFGGDRPEDLVLRERNARAILFQNCPDVPSGEVLPKRAELEGIGVPSSWFEEALAFRCGNRGDAFKFIQHLSRFSGEEARKALEELVLPNMLYMNRDDVQDSLRLVAAFPWDEASLATTIADFFQLAEDIIAVSSPDVDEDKKAEEIASLSTLAVSVKTRLQALQSNNNDIQDPSLSLNVIPSYKLVPKSSFLAEALTGVKFLQLQLSALAAGSSIWDDADLRGGSTRPLKVASELAFISATSSSDSTNAGASAGSPMTLGGLM